MVDKIKKGDRFWKGTSATEYIALKDESARGWVLCYAPHIDVAASRKLRFNTNHDPITIIKEEDNA
jgi:hypothetical protein